MTITDLQRDGLILFECLSGSRAYGLEVEGSDTDIKGVFLLPRARYYGFDYVPQVANATNDVVYYELGRFLDLLAKNNPTALEMLGTPAHKVRKRHPLLADLQPALFLSKRCKETFGGFAFTQIRKARGLNKKISNPVAKERKSVLDFCYVLHGQGDLLLSEWLALNDWQQSQLGLVAIPHAREVYGVYLDEQGNLGYKGIAQKENSNQLSLSSVPPDARPVAHLSFNRDGYSTYCRDYRNYWQWVAQRNENRYLANVAHGKNYDSKNMMHTFRLLDMAEEILRLCEVIVERPNREELLAIRHGKWTYDELMGKAEEKLAAIEIAYANSALPAQPDRAKAERLLVQLRADFYRQ
ncbi:MAG: nucleotidyltransferase domain-containing protein [Bacteroidota bacterium]